jgi:large-conductance mechanosensitive channel
MIRLFLFAVVRFFIIALALYVALTLLQKVIRFLQGNTRPSPRGPQQGAPPKAKETYKDVKDATFSELPNKQSKDQEESIP